MNERYVNSFFSVRLAGGMSSREGNLHVLHNGVWGTVCADAFYFNDTDARNVCSMLGFRYDLLNFIENTSYQQDFRLLISSISL